MVSPLIAVSALSYHHINLWLDQLCRLQFQTFLRLHEDFLRLHEGNLRGNVESLSAVPVLLFLS